jgi:hypothetical protein
MVKFTKGKLIPLQFAWRRQDYSVTRVELAYSGRKGNDKLYYFSVVASGVIYQLIFNSQTLSWRLLSVYTPGV